MDDKKTDVSTHNIPRPQPEEIDKHDYDKVSNVLNQVRIDIIKKTYG
jgi:hypothetical protein